MVGRRRGRIVTRDGTVHEVPEFMLDEEEIRWPPGMPQRRPGEPIAMISQDDFYRRHEIVEGEAYLFLKREFMPGDVPPGVIEELLEGREYS